MSNNLVNETSPYLLQHKDNPVEWFSWGKYFLVWGIALVIGAMSWHMNLLRMKTLQK